MKIIKIFFGTLFVLFFLILVTLFIFFTAASKGYLDDHLKKLGEFYLSKEGVDAVIDKFQVRNNKIYISGASFGMPGNARGDIKDLSIILKFSKIENNWALLNEISIKNFVITSKDNQEYLKATVDMENVIDIFKNNLYIKMNLQEMRSDILSDPTGVNLPIGQSVCFYKARLLAPSTKKNLNCTLTFDDKASLDFKSSLHNNIEIHGNVTNIPITIYQIAQKILPNNEVILYLQEHIKSGNIQKGEFDVILEKNFLKTYILPDNAFNGKIHITNLEYLYDVDFPALNEADIDIMILGSEMKFLVNKAYSGTSLISNGVVNFKWEGLDRSNVIIKADAQGPVVDLVDFIPKDAYESTKSQGIDLKAITGTAISKINIKVPIKSDIKNTYDISTKLSDVSLQAFNKAIILKNVNANGVYYGDKIVFTGAGKINNFNSTFMYEHDMRDNNKNDYDCLLRVKSNIKANNNKFGILSFISGNSIFNFEYKKKESSQAIISGNINLNKIDFYLDKISFHKKLNKDARLTFKGKLAQGGDNIDFNLSGEDNLKIAGNVIINKNKYNINFSSINYGQTSLNGLVMFDQDNLKVDLKGNRLDLANSNMMQFLKKNEDAQNTDLRLYINRVRLKNDIWLSNLKLDIKCDKLKCSSGSLNANIGTKLFDMKLSLQSGYEQWIINCSNAGALLRAIGMYNNMKAGNINLILNTNRQQVRKGEIIPILDGKFTIKRFVVTDTPFLTRLVSFVSLPGLMSSIVNNKDILFENMTGEFNYIGDIITLSDAEATGPFFDFSMKGKVDTQNKKINLKGNVVPSFFFVSSVITKIPVLGKIFSKVAPYSLELKYKD